MQHREMGAYCWGHENRGQGCRVDIDEWDDRCDLKSGTQDDTGHPRARNSSPTASYLRANGVQRRWAKMGLGAITNSNSRTANAPHGGTKIHELWARKSCLLRAEITAGHPAEACAAGSLVWRLRCTGWLLPLAPLLQPPPFLLLLLMNAETLNLWLKTANKTLICRTITYSFSICMR